MVFIAPPATVPPLAVLPAAAVSTASPAPHGWGTYVVRAGDTLEGIAARHRTTIGVLVARNHIRDRHLIMAGTRLTVPRTAAPAKAAAARSTVHTVRAGDTLSGIAIRYRVPLASLLKTNHISASAFIHPGQRLTVRGAAATAAAARAAAANTAKAATYTVRNGDTLGGIAVRHRTTVGAIAKASGISSRSVIHPGQRLRLPASASKSAARSSVPDTFNGVKYPSAIAQAAARNRAILAKAHVPSRSETRAMIITTARRHGVDPKLALAIAYQESGWNQRAVSVANAVGVMQVIPSGGQWASSLVGRHLNLRNTQDNITAGVVMLRALGRATSKTEHQVAAYYQGLGALQKNGMYSDTKGYVRNVLLLRKTM
ncbi:LysM peptidoglycan-binding domain-containing protein [Oryzobacter telluris]|uniref:LysM peptidoglycan-binding domain-containing protein n=1 Tax=Oryzobacter telluris TaxID=3149179 RepID=UPI00370D9064